MTLSSLTHSHTLPCIHQFNKYLLQTQLCLIIKEKERVQFQPLPIMKTSVGLSRSCLFSQLNFPCGFHQRWFWFLQLYRGKGHGTLTLLLSLMLSNHTVLSGRSYSFYSCEIHSWCFLGQLEHLLPLTSAFSASASRTPLYPPTGLKSRLRTFLFPLGNLRHTLH